MSEPVEQAEFDLLMLQAGLDNVECNYDREHEGKFGPDPCTAPARWSNVCPECSNLWMYCHKHRRGLDRYINEQLSTVPQDGTRYAIKCVLCNAELEVPIPWSAL